MLMSSSKKGRMDVTVDQERLVSIIASSITSQEPLMIWGPPGIGKSDIVKQVADDMGRELIDIRLSLYDSVDIKGYPYIDEQIGRLRFAMSNEFPHDPESTAIIFFDEINAGSPTTQHAMFQLILNRRCGEYSLPKGVAVIAAGNRQEDKGGHFAMPKPLENRFIHVELEANTKSWIKWAIYNEVNPTVVGFINKFPQHLNNFDPDRSTRAFATSRSWTKAGKMITHMQAEKRTESEIRDVVAGTVGYEMATTFFAYKKIADRLPNIDDILSGKVKKCEMVDESGNQDNSLIFVILTNALYAIRLWVNENENSNDIDKISKEYDNFISNLLSFFQNSKVGEEFQCMIVSSIIQMQNYNKKVKFSIAKNPILIKAIHDNVEIFKNTLNIEDKH